MSGFFSRCKYLSRKFFWPHLLLGMIAASLGMPANSEINSDPSPVHPGTARVVGNFVFEPLQRICETARRPNVAVDHWHQHAMRVVFRHFSFSIPQTRTPTAQHKLLTLFLQRMTMLQWLSTQIITLYPDRTALIPLNYSLKQVLFISFFTALWLAIVQGIRAGPHAQFI